MSARETGLLLLAISSFLFWLWLYAGELPAKPRPEGTRVARLLARRPIQMLIGFTFFQSYFWGFQLSGLHSGVFLRDTATFVAVATPALAWMTVARIQKKRRRQ